jgi:hypothetical protein
MLIIALVFFACKTIPIDFMPARYAQLQNFVEVTNIEDYETLVKFNNIKTVFYTDEFFIVEINSVLYALQTRGYKNFHDYKEGKLAQPEEHSIYKPGYSLNRSRDK